MANGADGDDDDDAFDHDEDEDDIEDEDEVDEQEAFDHDECEQDDEQEPGDEEGEEFDLVENREELLESMGLTDAGVVGQDRHDSLWCDQCAERIERGMTAYYSEDDGAHYCIGCCDVRLRWRFGR